MVNFGPSLRTYASQREVVYARRSMVCTTQPLASQAGLAMLKKGGNAIDAARSFGANKTAFSSVALKNAPTVPLPAGRQKWHRRRVSIGLSRAAKS